MTPGENITYMQAEGADIDWLRTLTHEELERVAAYVRKQNRTYRTTECTMFEQSQY